MLDSAEVKTALRRAVAAIIGGMLSMILLLALLLCGFYLLIQATVMALSPWLGAAGALAATGALCILLLAVVFQRLTRPLAASGTARSAEGVGARNGSGIEGVRARIREHPLEAALGAFAVGLIEQGDPRLKSLLLEAATELLRSDEAVTSQHTAAGQANQKNPS